MSRLAFLALLLLATACSDASSVSPPSTGEGARPPMLPAPGAGGGTGGTEALPPTASLMTWNLETFPLTASTPERTIELLEEMQPDVVALQEITEPGAFYDMLDALPEYSGLLNDDPGAYLRLGLLYRTDRVRVDGVETLFDGNWYAFPRPPLKAHITLADGVDFDLVVVHLKAYLDEESQDRRASACNILDEWIHRRAMQEPEVIVVGDFNDKLLDPPEWNVFDAFFDRPELYQFTTLPLEQAGQHTYIPFDAMIDHVLATRKATALIERTEVLPLEERVQSYRDISDHRPVRTWLRW